MEQYVCIQYVCFFHSIVRISGYILPLGAALKFRAQAPQNSMNYKVCVWMTVSKQQKPVNKETGNQQNTEAKKKDAQHGDRFLF